MYPDGVYEYGQIGIGTCLAAPVDLAFLDDGRLAVANANSFGDFTGGSLLTLDVSTVGAGRTLVTDLAPAAVDLPSFAGAMAVIPEHGLVAVPTRLSAEARTRQVDDDLWFVDVSDPAAPALATDWGDAGGRMTVGADPNATLYDPAARRLWVANRTDHDVMMIDVSAAPGEIVPPGGEGRVTADDFVDADQSGSRASFVTLEAVDAEIPRSLHYELDWNVATVRAWIPDGRGLARVTGNGEDLWVRSAVEYDLAVDDSGGAVAEILSPWFYYQDDGMVRMLFVDEGNIRVAESATIDDSVELPLTAWRFDTDPLLEPAESGWDTVIGGPAMVSEGGTWYLFYDGGDGGARGIGLAASTDGYTFVRQLTEPLLGGETESYRDPFVFFDAQAGRWRMYFSVIDGDAWSIGQAWSDDLLTWEESEVRFAPPGGASAPALGYYGGRFHLFYVKHSLDRSVWEATSVDGYTWEERGPAFALDATAAGDRPRIALETVPEGVFTLADDEGDVLPVVLASGDTLVDDTNGYAVRVAVGQVLDPEDFGAVASGGVQLDAVDDGEAFFTVIDGDGRPAIAAGALDGERRVSVEPETLVLEGDADWSADGVYSPVVATVGGERVMWFAGIAGGVSAIGRAVQSGGRWVADPEPVFDPGEEWDSVGVAPGSVVLEADGTLRLYYTGDDGDTLRIGEATSTDGVRWTRVEGERDAWSLDPGTPGDWDDSGVRDPYVIREGDVEHLWYAGSDGTAWRIGYASRTSGGDWERSTGADGGSRPILSVSDAVFGRQAVRRPVVVDDAGGRALWYTGEDAAVGRVGLAVLDAPDRAWRDLRLPTLADTWGFTVVPERDEDAILLDVVTGSGAESMALGCASMAWDEGRGFVYVACTETAQIYVLDARDDSATLGSDLNALDIEGVLQWTPTLQEAGSAASENGFRQVWYDAERDWLWALASIPESLSAFDLSRLEDNDEREALSTAVVASLTLPNRDRDEGVPTEANLGPGRVLFHPDGRYAFVSNFNDNSVAVYDFALGAPATLVALVDDLGENPYAMAIDPSGTRLWVANLTGEVRGEAAAATLVAIDVDPASPDFLTPIGWVVNR